LDTSVSSARAAPHAASSAVKKPVQPWFCTTCARGMPAQQGRGGGRRGKVHTSIILAPGTRVGYGCATRHCLHNTFCSNHLIRLHHCPFHARHASICSLSLQTSCHSARLHDLLFNCRVCSTSHTTTSQHCRQAAVP
jgi:hypothetical protein